MNNLVGHMLTYIGLYLIAGLSIAIPLGYQLLEDGDDYVTIIKIVGISLFLWPLMLVWLAVIAWTEIEDTRR
jgi:O-antigen/teichoic acid export membrane protein